MVSARSALKRMKKSDKARASVYRICQCPYDNYNACTCIRMQFCALYMHVHFSVTCIWPKCTIDIKRNHGIVTMQWNFVTL